MKEISQRAILKVWEEELLLEVKSIRACSNLIRWMVQVISNGLMEVCLKVNGEEEKRMEKENTIGLMARSMKENSRTMNATAMVSFTTHAARNLKVLGKMARKMVAVSTLGPMVLAIPSSTLMGRNKEKESWRGLKSIWIT